MANINKQITFIKKNKTVLNHKNFMTLEEWAKLCMADCILGRSVVGEKADVRQKCYVYCTLHTWWVSL